MKKHLVFWACATIVLALSCLVWTAAAQNNDNGGVMPMQAVLLAGGDGVGGIDVYTFPASYHGTPVLVGLVTTDLCVVVYGGTVFALPVAALDKLDGGLNPATVGTTTCWHALIGSGFYQLSESGSGPSLSCAASAFASNHANVTNAQEALGMVQIACP